jgi:hypothetical protein
MRAAVTLLVSMMSVSARAETVCGGGGINAPLCAALEVHLSTAQSPDHGSSVAADGGFCVFSTRSATGGYRFCGALSATFGAALDWGVLRGAIALSARLPGTYSEERGAAAQGEMDQNLKAFRDHVQRLLVTRSDISAAMHDYGEKTVAPASSDLVKRFSGLRQELKSQLMPAITAQPRPSGPFVQPPSLDPGALLSDGVRAHVQAIESEQNPQARWRRIEAARQLLDEGGASLSLAERAALVNATNPYVNSGGLPNEKLLGSDLGDASAHLSRAMQTSISTRDAREVRRVIGRGLMACTLGPEARATAWGGIALASGADSAFADGHTEDGWTLLGLGSQTIDFALGVIPVVGAANDLTQIVFGMATGHDYSGNAMTRADYALRGVGVVLGLLPLSGSVIKVGSAALGRSFAVGADLIRGSRLGQKAAQLLSRKAVAPVAVEVVSAIGEIAPALPVEARRASQLAADVENTLELFADPRLGSEGRIRLLKTLEDAGIKREVRLSLARSAKAGTIEYKVSTKSTYFYRWHHFGTDGYGEQIGRFFTPQLIKDPAAARRLLAITEEQKNLMLVLQRYEIAPGEMFLSNVRAQSSLPGQGRQMFLPLSDEALRERIRHIETILDLRPK